MEAPYDMTPVKKENIYTKPIVVLVNAVTFSSAENFCVTFRGMRRGKIIGMPTGGSTGNPINLNLGYGIGAVICTKNDWDIDGNKFIGIGIKPDIEVQESADIFLKGKDVVIEEALKQIGRDKK
ncbi:MAG: S41 family peptidase, partial [Candidatus Paceibacterota bacterium]|jgi:C-terminal processing protease CtpA/Prc